MNVSVPRRSGTRPQPCDDPDRGWQCDTDMSHSWGQYSPYFSVPSEIDASLPDGCELTFAQVLSRHGARDPTSGKTVAYAALLQRIKDTATAYGPGYEFIKSFNYTLGADQLTALGRQQMVNSGRKFYHRYRALASKSVPFVRASDQDRVVHSAGNFTRGFHEARLRDPAAAQPPPRFPYDTVLISEDPDANNTLHHGLCRAFEEGAYSGIGSSAQEIWRGVFAPPITARLNANLPGANLTDADTVFLMDLCPFGTVASADGAPSPFCGLFGRDEWRAYDYLQSLGKWYGFGPGNPLGPTQGVGYVNELLARLTRTPVRDRTSTNSTLDADPRTFPLDRALYADFGHDNVMTSVLGALRLYEHAAGGQLLGNTTRREPRDAAGFAASWTVPFAARIYVEKMRCGGGGDDDDENGEELVRVLVNDRVVPLNGCGADALGRCTLGRFVESMEFAREGGRWDWCFE